MRKREELLTSMSLFRTQANLAAGRIVRKTEELDAETERLKNFVSLYEADRVELVKLELATRGMTVDELPDTLVERLTKELSLPRGLALIPSSHIIANLVTYGSETEDTKAPTN
jgi:hypothetical protein